MTYVLEVCKFNNVKDGPDGWLLKNTKYKHIGYMHMQAKFRTKENACSYYDKYNPNMRSLNEHGTLK